MSEGLFISFEGIDGAGKSSHVEALAQAFRDAGRQVVQTREPGGTPLAEQLRGLVLHQPMDALTEALVMFAARRDHLTQVIEPGLARGDVVLCDRFSDATFAYQGGGRGFDLSVLGQLERWVQSVDALPAGRLRQPHLTVWFDVPVEVAASRVAAARSPDRFEAETQEFFRRVAGGYAQREAADPQRFARIDGARSREQVREQVLQAMRARGWLA